MDLGFATSPLIVAALALSAFGVVVLITGVMALFRARPLRFALRTLAGLLLFVLGALVAIVAVGIQGYKALTREELAARLLVQPDGPQRFATTIRYADGREAKFAVAGDEVYIDAHVLKWKPIANLFGLHTAYELDRIAGRYHSIEQERSAPRTVYALGPTRPVDLFGLRQRHTFLAPLLDADYGSATFVPVTQPVELEVRVSTSGLLLREAERARN